MQVQARNENPPSTWYIDSGCSRHMSGDKNLFAEIKPKNQGYVTFGDNNKGKVIGIGKVGKEPLPTIDNVLLVDGLKHNLLSVSQLCDMNFNVSFESSHCVVKKDENIAFIGLRHGNTYVVDLHDDSSFNEKCLVTLEENAFLWHRKLGHAPLPLISKLSKNDIVRGLPKIKFVKDHLCESCLKGKHVRESFKPKKEICTSRILELVHMDLIGPSRHASLSGKLYVLVIVDDFSRFTWVRFLANKSDAFNEFTKWCRLVQNEKNLTIVAIRTDHGGEFDCEPFEKLCDKYGMEHNFSTPRTPQQNGVVERKNRSLEEMSRTMLNEYNLSKTFWAEAINTACYVINRVHLRRDKNKTPYELWKGKKPNISYFHPFGCKVFIHNNGKNNLGKFDSKSDVGIFLGYSLTSKAFRVYNNRTRSVEENIHVKFDDMISPPRKVCFDDDAGNLGNEVEEKEANDEEKLNEEDHVPIMKTWAKAKNHPMEQVIGGLNDGLRTRRNTYEYMSNSAFISLVEPKNIKEALEDENWMLAMQEELNQFKRNNVWDLVAPPKDKTIIGVKWVNRIKYDENGEAIKNKSRLVAQGFYQEEGLDYNETFAPVARLEAIRLLCAFASHKKIKLNQMDVKSAFLNGYIQEEVYVKQPPGFEDHEHPDYVYKLKKALYGLKQAPRAWYERLSTFLTQNGYIRGKVDNTLFIKHVNKDMLVCQIYVDDIVFGATNESLCKEFSDLMQSEFEMSMMGELKFFLGLQIKQYKDGIFIHQSKYTKELLKKFNMDGCKVAATPMASNLVLEKSENEEDVDQKLYRGMIGSLLYLTASRPDIMFATCLCARFQSCPKISHLTACKRIFRYLSKTINHGLWYPCCDSFDLYAYSDADYGGCRIDRKSTSGICHFLGSSLISWASKKQVSVAISTAESEYVAAGSACAQVLWLKHQLLDYGIVIKNIPIYCDNTSAICLSKNPILHSRTKHIEIRHHFIRDHCLKGDIVLKHVSSSNQLADIFTKPLKEDVFINIKLKLGMCDLNSLG